MADIQAAEIATLREGTWHLMRVTAPGTYGVPDKGGEVEKAFHAGDVLIASSTGSVVVMPIGPEGARALARRVAEGDARATTDPLAMLTLATAVLGLLPRPSPETNETAQAATGA